MTVPQCADLFRRQHVEGMLGVGAINLDIKEGYISYSDKISKNNPCNPKRLSETKKGKIWVHDEKGSKMIFPNEKDDYFSKGYKSGRGKYPPCSDERKEKIRKFRTGTKRIIIDGKLKVIVPIDDPLEALGNQ